MRKLVYLLIIILALACTKTKVADNIETVPLDLPDSLHQSAIWDDGNNSVIPQKETVFIENNLNRFEDTIINGLQIETYFIVSYDSTDYVGPRNTHVYNIYDKLYEKETYWYGSRGRIVIKELKDDANIIADTFYITRQSLAKAIKLKDWKDYYLRDLRFVKIINDSIIFFATMEIPETDNSLSMQLKFNKSNLNEAIVEFLDSDNISDKTTCSKETFSDSIYLINDGNKSFFLQKHPIVFYGDQLYEESDTVIDDLEIKTLLMSSYDPEDYCIKRKEIGRGIFNVYNEFTKYTLVYYGSRGRIIIRNGCKSDTTYLSRGHLIKMLGWADEEDMELSTLRFSEVRSDSLIFRCDIFVPDSDLGACLELKFDKHDLSAPMKVEDITDKIWTFDE